MKNQIFKLKKYNNYQEIPNQYKWDLDDILNGKTIDQLINEYFCLFDELILIKDSKYDTIQNYISYLNINKSFLILKNKIINYFNNLININIVDSKALKQSDDFELKEQEYQIKLGSEINRIYKNKDSIKKWLNDPRLKDVKKDLEFIIQNFDHKLDDNVEKYLNETYIGDPSLEDIFSTLTNSEIDFGYAISKDNKKYKITESSRVLLLKNKDEKIRKTTYYGYLNGFYNLRETLTKLLYQHLKKISIESSIRKYESSINSLISSDKIEIAFLTNLFSSITNKTNKIFKNFLKYKSIFFKKKFNKKMELWDSYLELVNVKNNYKKHPPPPANIKTVRGVQTAKKEPEIAVFQACRKRSEINFAWNYNLLKIQTLTIKFFCRKYSKFLHKKFVIRIFFVPLQSQIRRVYSVKLLTLNGLGVLEKYF